MHQAKPYGETIDERHRSLFRHVLNAARSTRRISQSHPPLYTHNQARIRAELIAIQDSLTEQAIQAQHDTSANPDTPVIALNTPVIVSTGEGPEDHIPGKLLSYIYPPNGAVPTHARVEIQMTILGGLPTTITTPINKLYTTHTTR